MSNGNHNPQYFENPNPHRFNNPNPHQFNPPNPHQFNPPNPHHFNHPNRHYVDNRHFVFNLTPNSMDPEAQMQTQIQIQAPMHAQQNYMPMVIQGDRSMQGENYNPRAMYDDTLPPQNYGQTYEDPAAIYQDPMDELTALPGDVFESSYPDPLTCLKGSGSAPLPYTDGNLSMNGTKIPHQVVSSTQNQTVIPLPNLSPQISDSSFISDDTKGSFSSPQVGYTGSVTTPIGEMSNARPYASPNFNPNISMNVGMNIGTNVNPNVINPVGLHAGPNFNHNNGINIGTYVDPTVVLNRGNVKGFVHYVPMQSQRAANYQTPPLSPPLSPQLEPKSQPRTTSSPSTTPPTIPSTPVSKKRGRPRANITPEERTAKKLEGNRKAARRCRDKAKREFEAKEKDFETLRQRCENLERMAQAQRELIQRYEEERAAREWDELI